MLRAALTLALCAVSACTSTYQRRGIENPQPWADAVHLDEFESNVPPGQEAGIIRDDPLKVYRRLDAEARSIERYYVGPSDVNKETAPRFSLSIVEIADDGNFNPSQYDQVMRNLRCELSLADRGPDRDALRVANRCEKLAADEKRRTGANAVLDASALPQRDSEGTLLVVFVHGWHHGCATCDRDIACYRAVLSRLAETEAKLGTGRRVVGVYVGWRGRLFRGSWDYLSIWDRKRTADRLGRTAGKELLNDLHTLWKGHHQVTMVTAGHSLGGAFLLSAARGRLTGNVGDVMRGGEIADRAVRADGSRADAFGKGSKAIRSRFGDLLVLLNPAVEAEEWKVFDDDLRNQSLAEKMKKENPDPKDRAAAMAEREIPIDLELPYDVEQLPVMIAIGSTADGAVGKFFPASRWIAGLNPFEADALFKRNERVAVGHYDRHVTHHLTATTGPRSGDPQYEDMRRCTCPETAIRTVEASSALAAPSDPRELFYDKERDQRKRIWKLTLDESRDCDEQNGGADQGKCSRGWDRNSPYVVVQTDSTVIGAHSDVFNPVVVTFLQEYIASYQKYRRGRSEENLKSGF